MKRYSPNTQRGDPSIIPEFDRAMRALVQVPKSEVDNRKQPKKRKRTKNRPRK